MAEIIPYYDDLGPRKGAFIRPDGKVLFIRDNKHEEFAERYCNGRDYSVLTGAAFGPPVSTGKFLESIAEMQKNTKKGIDIFSSSSLSKVQLERYKKWLQDNKEDISYCDFLVLVLAFDKVEAIVNKVITTTAAEPHVRFFNYYLMDWEIKVQSPIIYDDKEATFRYKPHTVFSTDYNDREAEEEINEIKKYVLAKDRPYFFK